MCKKVLTTGSRRSAAARRGQIFSLNLENRCRHLMKSSPPTKGATKVQKSAQKEREKNTFLRRHLGKISLPLGEGTLFCPRSKHFSPPKKKLRTKGKFFSSIQACYSFLDKKRKGGRIHKPFLPFISFHFRQKKETRKLRHDDSLERKSFNSGGPFVYPLCGS